MHVIVDLCVIPIGVGVSLSEYIAEIQRTLEKAAGISFEMHAYGTNIEGEWDDVFGTVKECHQMVHNMGVPRIATTVKVGTRVDRRQSMNDKLRSVAEKLKPA
jgi:uncharacterized protein (TIGR00106 family)